MKLFLELFMNISAELNFFLQLLTLCFNYFVLLSESTRFISFLYKFSCPIALTFSFEFCSLKTN